MQNTILTFANYIKSPIKKWFNKIIDARIKAILADEKLDNIAQQLTENDIEYINFLKASTNSNVKINFAGEAHIKMKRLGIINESLDYKASCENLYKLIKDKPIKGDPLVAYITFTKDCDEVLAIINDTKNFTLPENLKKTNDLTKTRNTLIQKGFFKK